MTTEHRDLRSGETLWQTTGSRRPASERLRRGLRCDVVVVGAGVSGAMAAEALSECGLRVVLLDRRGPCLGSTSASTALLQFEIDTPLTALGERMGVAAAARVWQRSAAAVTDLAAKVRALRLRCDLTQRSSIYLAGDRLGSHDLQREVRARQRIGLPSQYLDRHALRRRIGIERSGAILSAGAAEADPVRLTAGLLRRALRRGARLFAPVEVAEVHAGARAVEVQTRDGLELRCRHLVYATGYELAASVPRKGHRLASTWAIATRPQPRQLWTSGDLLWEASDPYLYARTTADGRVIAGGEDEEFTDADARDALIPAKAKRISAKLARLLPQLDARAQLRWTGTFGESRNGLPTIGEIPDLRRCYAILGFGGNGITFSMLAARILRGAIVGPRDPDAELFRFRE